MKKLAAVLLTVVLILVPVSNIYADSCSYTHAVSCDCCGDVAWVTHRLIVSSHTDVKTTMNVYSGEINAAITALTIKGKIGDTWGDELQLWPTRSMAATYDWSPYVTYVASAKATFSICKGKSWAIMEGTWVNAD